MADTLKKLLGDFYNDHATVGDIDYFKQEAGPSAVGSEWHNAASKAQAHAKWGMGKTKKKLSKLLGPEMASSDEELLGLVSKLL